MPFADSVSTTSQFGRRSHARHRLEGLVYVDFGPDNGAILIDLGEGGLGFQSVIPVGTEQALLLKFKLPGESNHIEGYAEVAWVNESGKGGGLRFIDLSGDALGRIRNWTHALLVSETIAPQAESGADSNPAPENLTEGAPDHSIQESTDSAPISGANTPSPISESFATGKSAQPPSPQADEVFEAEQADNKQISAGPAPDGLPLPESTADVVAASDSIEALASETETIMPAMPSASLAGAADSGTPEAVLAEEEESEQNVADATGLPPALPSNDSSSRGSDVRQATPGPETIAALHASTEIEPRTQRAPAANVSRGPASVARTPQVASGISNPTPVRTAQAMRVPASDSRNVVVQKAQRKAATSKPESPLPPADGQDRALRGSLVRQSPSPSPKGRRPESLPAVLSAGDELKSQATLASQVLKIGLGAAAGAGLVLALIAGVPFLKTRVQATANAKSIGPNLAGVQEFQVEVADLDNRRWVLTSGGPAGSPFNDVPSRPETQPAARNGTVKPSRSNDAANSGDKPGDKGDTSQPKLPQRSELALSRPHATQLAASSAQLLAPSIFDGITPPIGSVSNSLAAVGPDVPGVVPPEGPAALRKSALQSPVLLERVAPVYPKDALQARVQGEVRVNATIGRDGIPRNLKVIRGDQRLVTAALTAISQWRYRPALLGDEPTETQTVIILNFELK